MRHSELNVKRVDSDLFIDKTLRTLSSLLSAFRRSAAIKTTLPAVAAARFFSVILMLVLVSISQTMGFVIIYLTALLVLLATRRPQVIISALRNSLLAGLVTGIIFLPAALYGNLFNTLFVCIKCFCMIMSLSILTAETRWESLFAALSLLKIPDLVILILDITLKYIFLLGEYAFNLLVSLKLRSIGRNPLKKSALARIAGTLFLKSAEAAQRLHQAMECRGFTGTYAVRRKMLFSFEILIMVLADSLLVYLFLGVK